MKYDERYPLIDWNMGRDECVEAIRRAGLAVPSKSACFFCPATTKPQIIQLGRDHPKLLSRALAMEANAKENLSTVTGLGRRFAWADFVAGSPSAFPEIDIACDCYDESAD